MTLRKLALSILERIESPAFTLNDQNLKSDPSVRKFLDDVEQLCIDIVYYEDENINLEIER